jgi:uncharacterized protein (DUF488 family)
VTDRALAIGWGYQGRELDDLAKSLRAWQARALVDVRLNPVSRKRGFSRKALAEACAEWGVEYIHLPALGNPRDNRDGFGRAGGARTEAHERYRREVLLSAPGQQAIQALASVTREGLVVVLCFEASEGQCHRSLVLQALHDHTETQPVNGDALEERGLRR